MNGSGNSYVTGGFDSNSITFGTTTLTSAGGSDLFAVKYDTGGNVVWAKIAGGSNYDWSYSIAVEVSGNSFVTGYFRSSSITFGTTTLTNAGSVVTKDIYIVKYDASGNAVWAKSAGGSGDDYSTAIALAVSGNSSLI